MVDGVEGGQAREPGLVAARPLVEAFDLPLPVARVGDRVLDLMLAFGEAGADLVGGRLLVVRDLFGEAPLRVGLAQRHRRGQLEVVRAASWPTRVGRKALGAGHRAAREVGERFGLAAGEAEALAQEGGDGLVGHGPELDRLAA